MDTRIADHRPVRHQVRHRRAWPVGVLLLSLASATIAFTVQAELPAAAATVGYRDFSFGTGVSAPTGEKPQSKLWFNDGIWWGSLFNAATSDYHIYRYSWATSTWTSTGTLIDERSAASMDTFWDGNKLHVVSAGNSAANTSHAPRFIRFSYDAATKRYTRDAGFPVTFGRGGMDALTVARDSTGTLWATWVEGTRVLVAHSTTSDSSWVSPYVLPLPGASNLLAATDGDLSAVVNYDGTRIGIMWSNQNDMAMYFGTHVDGAPDGEWTRSTAYQSAKGADDHINLKSLQTDPAGRVFAAVKTSNTVSTDALVNLLALGQANTWTSHVFGTVADDHTRAIVLIDSENRNVYLFASAPCCSGGVIYYKKSGLDRISFPPGKGTPFIQSSTDPKINNPTSTKQNLNRATGLVVMAGDDSTDFYLHNRIDLGSTSGEADISPPDTTITSGPTGSTTSRSANFTYSSSEAGSTFECAIDGATFSACPATGQSYTALTEGGHTFRVRATDAAGNTDTTPASRMWTVSLTLLRDSFESGDFRNWTAVKAGGDGRARVLRSIGTSGSYGAEFYGTTNPGSNAYARKTLPAAQKDITVSGQVRFTRQGDTGQVPFVRLLDASAKRLVTVQRQGGSGRLYVVIGSTSYQTSSYLPVGAPYSRFFLRVLRAGSGASTVDLYINGSLVYRTTTAGLTAGVRILQIANDSTKQAFTMHADNIVARVP